MNNPEGYVLVQVKQLAQWREWANNVAAWSTKSDRSSEVARLKASISNAMISATQPTASNAGEREALIDLIAQHLSGTYHCHRVWNAWNVGTMSQDDFSDVGESDTPAEIADAVLAALASKPVAPPARELRCTCGNEWEWSSDQTMWELAHVATTPAPAGQTDTERLDAMQAHRIAVVPEFEGPWDAEVYGEEGEPLARGSGNTPREAIDEALRAARGDEVNQK